MCQKFYVPVAGLAPLGDDRRARRPGGGRGRGTEMRDPLVDAVHMKRGQFHRVESGAEGVAVKNAARAQLETTVCATVEEGIRGLMEEVDI
jgi:hypothetical protein